MEGPGPGAREVSFLPTETVSARRPPPPAGARPCHPRSETSLPTRSQAPCGSLILSEVWKKGPDP